MSDLEPAFLTLAEALDIHAEMIAHYGGDMGVRDIGLLESALAMPQASFAGCYLHATLFEMAAAYAYHMAENQPFIDGNKRAALGAALTFLRINGLRIQDPSQQLYKGMIKIGTRRMTKQELAGLLALLAA
jgi:death-on-curing protein